MVFIVLKKIIQIRMNITRYIQARLNMQKRSVSIFFSQPTRVTFIVLKNGKAILLFDYFKNFGKTLQKCKNEWEFHISPNTFGEGIDDKYRYYNIVRV